MAIHPGVRTDPRPSSPIERLVRERGLRRFGLFFVTGEGNELPNGDEEQSGYVIDDRGQIYSFWTGWDSTRHEVVFTEWERVDEEPEWRGVREYDRARMLAGAPPTFEELLDDAGWLAIPEMVVRLEAADYWLRHPTVLSRRAKERHVKTLLGSIRGPQGIPVFIRAKRQGSDELEYIHPLSAKPDDIRREGRYLLAESMKNRPSEQRLASKDCPTMTMDSEGRLVIRPASEASPEDVARIQALLDHLQDPDAEAQEEYSTQGVLSERLRSRIERGELSFRAGVAQQEQLSTRVHLRTSEGLRLLAQLMAASEFLSVGKNEGVLSEAYEAGLFSS